MDSQILSTLMSCARLLDFRFNMHLQPSSGRGKNIEMGSMVHRILEEFYKNRIAGKSYNNAIDLEAGWNYFKGAEPEYQPTNMDISDANTVIDTMTQYFDFWRATDSWTPLEVECVKGKVIYEDDEIRLLWKAKLDLLVDTNAGIIPVDHKSMKQNRKGNKKNVQFIGQCVVSETRNMIVNKIGFQKTLPPEEKFLRAVNSYSLDNLAEFTAIAAYYAKQLKNYSEEEYFPPNFTHCDKWSGCMFDSVCNSDRGMRNEELKLHFHIGEPWDISDE